MHLRHWVRLVEWSILAFGLLLHVGYFVFAYFPYWFTGDDLLNQTYAGPVLHDTMLVLQPTLLVFLLFQGPGRWFVRIPVVMLGLAATGLGAASQDESGLLWIPLVLASAGSVGLISLGMRLFGWKLRWGEPATSRWRFSIAWLLIVTAGVGGFAAIVQGLRSAYGDQDIVPEMLGPISVGLLFGLVTWIGCWAALTGRSRWIPIGLFGLLTPAVGLLAPYMWGRGQAVGSLVVDTGDYWTFAQWFAAYGCVAIVSLMIIRFGGLRLARTTSASDPKTAAPASGETQPRGESKSVVTSTQEPAVAT